MLWNPFEFQRKFVILFWQVDWVGRVCLCVHARTQQSLGIWAESEQEQ